jgi:ribonuclease HI
MMNILKNITINKMTEEEIVKAFEKLIGRPYNANVDKKEFSFFSFGITAHINYQLELRKKRHEFLLPNFSDDYVAEAVNKNNLPDLKEGRPTKGVAVDVGCSGNPGKAEYRGVDLETGKVVFHVKIPGLSTNNIGEFLAAAEGLKYCKERGDNGYRVYSDSVTAIAWIRDKKCKSKLTDINGAQQDMIDAAEHYLKLDKTKVLFWNNKQWGEIPADFNRKAGSKGPRV